MARPHATMLRSQFGLRLEPQLMREVAHISVDEDKQLNALVEESLRDLMKHYLAKGKRCEVTYLSDGGIYGLR